MCKVKGQSAYAAVTCGDCNVSAIFSTAGGAWPKAAPLRVPFGRAVAKDLPSAVSSSDTPARMVRRSSSSSVF